MDREAFVWTSKTQTGVALFAISLVYLAAIAPSEIAISTLVGGGSALALFGITGSRFPLGILTMLMLVVTACAAFSLIMANGLALIPVAVAQVAAIVMMEQREERFWIRHQMLPVKRV